MTVCVEDYKRRWREEESDRRAQEPNYFYFGLRRLALPRMWAPIPPWFPIIEEMTELDVIDPAQRLAYAPNRPMVEGDL